MNYETFDSRGYDMFLGRTVWMDGKPAIMVLDLEGYGMLGCHTLDKALECMCTDIKNGDRFLLTQSPGSLPPRERQSENSVEGLKKMYEDPSTELRTFWEYIGGHVFETLSQKELVTLEEMYNRRIDMKMYPNPFLDQPSW